MCSKEQLHSDLLLGVAFHHNIKWANPSLASAQCSRIEIEGKIRSCSFGLPCSAASHSVIRSSGCPAARGQQVREYLLTSRLFLSCLISGHLSFLGGGGTAPKRACYNAFFKSWEISGSFFSFFQWLSRRRKESYFQPRRWWLIYVLIIAGEHLTYAKLKRPFPATRSSQGRKWMPPPNNF